MTRLWFRLVQKRNNINNHNSHRQTAHRDSIKQTISMFESFKNPHEHAANEDLPKPVLPDNVSLSAKKKIINYVLKSLNNKIK